MSDQSNTQKDPADWVTGDEPMTGAQESYLNTLAGEAGEQAPEALSKPRHPRRSTSCRTRPVAAPDRRPRPAPQ
jgi:hypothetical protein